MNCAYDYRPEMLCNPNRRPRLRRGHSKRGSSDGCGFLLAADTGLSSINKKNAQHPRRQNHMLHEDARSLSWRLAFYREKFAKLAQEYSAKIEFRTEGVRNNIGELGDLYDAARGISEAILVAAAGDEDINHAEKLHSTTLFGLVLFCRTKEPPMLREVVESMRMWDTLKPGYIRQCLPSEGIFFGATAAGMSKSKHPQMIMIRTFRQYYEKSIILSIKIIEQTGYTCNRVLYRRIIQEISINLSLLFEVSPSIDREKCHINFLLLLP
eukprot:284819874_5